MKRVGMVMFTVFSVLFLIAVGVGTMILFGDDDAEATPTPPAASDSSTPEPTEPPRATPTPERTSVPGQPTRTPRPTTTPAATATPPSGAGAITAGNVAELIAQGTIALEGATDVQHAIRNFAWSADSAQIAVPEPANNRVALYDADTRELIVTLGEQDEPVRSVAFSPDGTLLAAGSREITVWDVESNEPVATLEGHTSPALSLAFSPDGARIASTGADQSVRLWDAITGDQQAQLQFGVAGQAVAFSPDGAQIAARGERIVRVWDAESGDEVAALQHDALVTGMAFSPDGDQLATAAFNGAVQVWDLDTGEIAATLLPDEAGVQRLDLAYSLDGTVLAVGSGTQATLDLLDAETGEVLGTLNAEPLHTSVSLSPDGRQLAALSGERGETLVLWGLPG